jgi:hypothetical protein
MTEDVEEHNKEQVRKIEEKAKAYKRVFLDGRDGFHPDAKTVIDDLKQFCKVLDTSFNPNADKAIYINEGRREVFLRIIKFLEYEVLEFAKPTNIKVIEND